MVTLLFTSVFIIGILAVALYFWQKPAKSESPVALPPIPPPRGLFSEGETTQSASLEAAAKETEEQRSLLIAKARSGDKSALDEAHALNDREFYDELLNTMVAAAASDAGLLSLVSHVARNELPVNNQLAQAVLESWKKSPDRNSTAKALHVAALADDPELYQGAVEAALNYWRTGKLVDISPQELQALFDGEFWVLSSRTRSSGAGFVLKRILANARRELGNTTSVNQ
jgi:hypothetical protein